MHSLAADEGSVLVPGYLQAPVCNVLTRYFNVILSRLDMSCEHQGILEGKRLVYLQGLTGLQQDLFAGNGAILSSSSHHVACTLCSRFGIKLSCVAVPI